MTRQINPSRINHIEHLDDMVLYSPELCMKHLEKVLAGTERASLKWDGSPSIIVGKKDLVPFVSTKSFFNKTPLLLKSYDEILSQKFSTELSVIMFIALKFAESINDNIVYQGDVMFCPGNKIVSETDITFGLNLVKYKVRSSYREFNAIKNANLGVAFHTSYDYSDAEVQKIPFDILPDNTTDVYVFEPSYFTLSAEPETIQDLTDEVLRIQMFQNETSCDLKLFHELYRKYKTQSLKLYSDVSRYNPDEFEKFCFQCTAPKLFEGAHQARENCLAKLQELNTTLKKCRKYFQMLCSFTYKAQKLVIQNLEETNSYCIEAQHEGLVVSTDEYTIKYVNKYEFTKKNNDKRVK